MAEILWGYRARIGPICPVHPRNSTHAGIGGKQPAFGPVAPEELSVPRSRFVQTAADGRFTFEGIPVSTRCTLLGRLKIGETWHQASVDVAVTQPGPISAPDLVLQPRK